MVEPEMSRGGRHRNVRICRISRGRHEAALAALSGWGIPAPITDPATGRPNAALLGGHMLPRAVPVAGSAIGTMDGRPNMTGW